MQGFSICLRSLGSLTFQKNRNCCGSFAFRRLNSFFVVNAGRHARRLHIFRGVVGYRRDISSASHSSPLWTNHIWEVNSWCWCRVHGKFFSFPVVFCSDFNLRFDCFSLHNELRILIRVVFSIWRNNNIMYGATEMIRTGKTNWNFKVAACKKSAQPYMKSLTSALSISPFFGAYLFPKPLHAGLIH